MRFWGVVVFVVFICEHSWLSELCNYGSDKSCGHDLGRGTCKLFKYIPLEYKCLCNEHYSGDDCEKYDCFGIFHTDPGVCDNHGTCKNYNDCECETGYYGDLCHDWDCFGYGRNDTNQVCSGNGTCYDYNNCVCDPYSGYTGPKCNELSCWGVSHDEPDVCSGHGHCTNPNHCECQPEYSGTECDSWKCYGKEKGTNGCCGGIDQGICTSPDFCSCNLGYFGQECINFTCFGKKSPDGCGDQGTCVGMDICSCERGYLGLKCEKWGCGGYEHNDTMKVCSQHGSCEKPGFCECWNNGIIYYGELCGHFNCYDVSNVETKTVCSGHGNCTSPDICQCESGYKKSNCESWKCFGVYKNYTKSVCSGHGDCVAKDTCDCHGYYCEEECESWRCGIYDRSNPEVCNSRGNCYSPGICNCSGPFTPISLCEHWTCNGIDYSDTTEVCSGHGRCVLLEEEGVTECKCAKNYDSSPFDCGVWQCFEIDNSESNVCDGHGSCEEYNSCECEKSFQGTECKFEGGRDDGNKHHKKGSGRTNDVVLIIIFAFCILFLVVCCGGFFGCCCCVFLSCGFLVFCGSSKYFGSESDVKAKNLLFGGESIQDIVTAEHGSDYEGYNVSLDPEIYL